MAVLSVLKRPSSFSSFTISRSPWVCSACLGSIQPVNHASISIAGLEADLILAEINSLPMRTKGAAVATATNWITNFVIVEITPIGFQNLGWRFWPIWVGTNALFLPIIYLCYPETSSRTLEDLDAYFRSDPSLFVFRDRDAISSTRPLKYIERENEEVHRVEEQDVMVGKQSGRLGPAGDVETQHHEFGKMQ